MFKIFTKQKQQTTTTTYQKVKIYIMSQQHKYVEIKKKLFHNIVFENYIKKL